jgi:hypothetical protein
VEAWLRPSRPALAFIIGFDRPGAERAASKNQGKKKEEKGKNGVVVSKSKNV